MAQKFYNESSIQSIADAIRSKNGLQTKYTVSQMSNAIRELNAPFDEEEFNGVNSVAEDYLSASAAYSADNYDVSVVGDYASTTERNDLPAFLSLSLPSGCASVTVVDSETGAGITEAASGSYTVENLIPNRIYYCFAADSLGRILKAGSFKALGALRMISADNLINVRDLGGWACSGGTVKYGKLFRGCEFTGNALIHNQITETGKRVMTDLLGISYECDLRWDEETYGTDRQPGTDDDIVSSALGDSVEYRRFPIYYYLNGVQLGTPSVEITKNCLLYVMEQAIKGKTGYFHCMYGRDRTGTLACILLALLGVAQTDIDKDYELTTFIGTDSGLTAYRNSNNWVQMMTYFNGFSGSTFRDKVANWAVQLGISVETLNAYCVAMINGVPSALQPDVSTFAVTKSLNHATTTAPDTATQYQPFEADISADNGYLINGVTVTMGDADITSACFRGIKAEKTFFVNFSSDGNASLSNTSRSVKSGEGYSSFIVCDTGYNITDVTIMMGGINVSNYYSGGAIIIPQVTGNISITVTTEAASRLPSGYKEVEYIENTSASSAAYADLGITGKTGLKFIGKAQSYTSGDVYLFGSTNASSQRMIFGQTAYIGGSSATAIGLASANTDFDFEFDTTVGNSSVSITSSSETKTRQISNATAFDNGVTLGLFCRHGSSAYERFIAGRIYSLDIFDGNTKVLSLIPCKRISDSVAGFYDTVGGSFITSASTVPFTAGAEIN